MNASGKDLAQSIIEFLKQHAAVDQLSEVIEHLQTYYEREVKRSHVATVRVAHAWHSDEKEALKRELHSVFKKELELAFVVDPKVVGGFSVQVGDVMIDRTLKSKLEEVKQVLLK